MHDERHPPGRDGRVDGRAEEVLGPHRDRRLIAGVVDRDRSPARHDDRRRHEAVELGDPVVTDAGPAARRPRSIRSRSARPVAPVQPRRQPVVERRRAARRRRRRASRRRTRARAKPRRACSVRSRVAPARARSSRVARTCSTSAADGGRAGRGPARCDARTMAPRRRSERRRRSSRSASQPSVVTSSMASPAAAARRRPRRARPPSGCGGRRRPAPACPTGPDRPVGRRRDRRPRGTPRRSARRRRGARRPRRSGGGSARRRGPGRGDRGRRGRAPGHRRRGRRRPVVGADARPSAQLAARRRTSCTAPRSAAGCVARGSRISRTRSAMAAGSSSGRPRRTSRSSSRAPIAQARPAVARLGRRR